jgi:catechol 2,3-dioxygenase-like lactoylglutathione lyase family enzyme
MRFSAVDHVSYTVADLDESIRFYTLLFGEEPFLRKVWDQEYVARLCGYPRIVLDAAFWHLPQGPVLELLQFSEPIGEPGDPAIVNPGASHLGLACDDLRTEFARLLEAGVDLRSEEPVEIPWGPYKGGLACFVRDPDGNFIELFQVPPGGPAFGE